eukprot:254280-Rhodomonas_salina.1
MRRPIAGQYRTSHSTRTTEHGTSVRYAGTGIARAATARYAMSGTELAHPENRRFGGGGKTVGHPPGRNATPGNVLRDVRVCCCAMSGTALGYPTQCPVLTNPILLRACYATPGTDLRYVAMPCFVLSSAMLLPGRLYSAQAGASHFHSV